MSESNEMNKATQSLQMQMALDELREMLPLIIEQQSLYASIHKSRFDALIKVGFTEQQAISLVAQRSILEQ